MASDISEIKFPVHIRLGTVRATVWRNETENGQLSFNVTFDESVRKEDGWENRKLRLAAESLFVPESAEEPVEAAAA